MMRRWQDFFLPIYIYSNVESALKYILKFVGLQMNRSVIYIVIQHPQNLKLLYMIVCIMFYAIILEGAQARRAAPPPLPRAYPALRVPPKISRELSKSRCKEDPLDAVS